MASGGVMRAAVYLVYLALSGERDTLEAMYKYYVQGKDHAQIRDEMGARYGPRVASRVLSLRRRAGGREAAERVVAALYPKLKDCDSAVRWRPWVGWWCDLCRWQLWATDVSKHILQKHRREVRELAEKLLREAGLAP